MHSPRWICTGWAGILVCVGVGCGGADSPVPVYGTVTLDGQPVSARLSSLCRTAIRLGRACRDTIRWHVPHHDQALRGWCQAGDYRVIVVWEPPPPPCFVPARRGRALAPEMQKAIEQHQAKLKKAGEATRFLPFTVTGQDAVEGQGACPAAGRPRPVEQALTSMPLQPDCGTGPMQRAASWYLALCLLAALLRGRRCRACGIAPPCPRPASRRLERPAAAATERAQRLLNAVAGRDQLEERDCSRARSTSAPDDPSRPSRN
jgi:hypothetical protein